MKVEIRRKTKFHYDNQTIVNSPPKSDKSICCFADGFPIFSVTIFSIYDKNNPRHLLYREKNKYKHRNGVGKERIV